MKYPVEYEIAYKEAFQRLENLYKELKTYRAVAKTLDRNISHTYIYMVLKDGYRPRKGKLIKALGLPEVELVPMVICPHCKEPQVGNKCGCQAKPYPRLAKPKREDYRQRIRIDIEASTDKRTVQAIRDMNIEQRTAILKAAVAIQSVPPKLEKPVKPQYVEVPTRTLYICQGCGRTELRGNPTTLMPPFCIHDHGQFMEQHEMVAVDIYDI